MHELENMAAQPFVLKKSGNPKTKSEDSKHKISNRKRAVDEVWDTLGFGFVSNFGFRASNFPPG
jgi:hypothetical protein